MGFYTKFVQKLLDSGFRPVQNLYDSEAVTEESKYIGLLRRSGDVIYAVVVFNTDKEPHYLPMYKQVTGFFKQRFAVSGVSRIIVTGVFAAENPDDDLRDFCTVDIDSFDGEYTEIRWIAHTGQGKRLVPGHQPDKVLNIGSIADKSFGAHAGASSLRDMVASAGEKDRKRIKSNDFILTMFLLAVNGIVFAAAELAGGTKNTDVLIDFGAVQRDLVFGGQWFRLFTYMFLHIGLLHLLGNGLSLYILGSRTERYYGKLSYGVIYFISGVAAGIASVLFGDAVSAGASGAIFGLMGAMVAYTLVTGSTMDGFDLYLVLIFAIVGLGSGMLMENVNNIAHIGGFVCGFIVSCAILILQRIKTEKSGA